MPTRTFVLRAPEVLEFYDVPLLITCNRSDQDLWVLLAQAEPVWYLAFRVPLPVWQQYAADTVPVFRKVLEQATECGRILQPLVLQDGAAVEMDVISFQNVQEAWLPQASPDDRP